MIHQDVADPYPDLRRFLNAIYEKADLPEANFNQRDIVTHCINAFVTNGFKNEKSVVDNCEDINNDDLSLKGPNIPFILVTNIYKTIKEFRKAPNIEVCYIVKNILNLLFNISHVCMYMLSFIYHSQHL